MPEAFVLVEHYGIIEFLKGDQVHIVHFHWVQHKTSWRKVHRTAKNEENQTAPVLPVRIIAIDFPHILRVDFQPKLFPGFPDSGLQRRFAAVDTAACYIPPAGIVPGLQGSLLQNIPPIPAAKNIYGMKKIIPRP